MFFRLLSLLHSYNATFFIAELENDIWFKMTILKVETENWGPVSRLISQAEFTPLSTGKKIYVEKALHLCKPLSSLHKWIGGGTKQLKAERMIRKLRDQKKVCTHFFVSHSAFIVSYRWNTVYWGEYKRWQESIVSRPVPIHTQRRADERWKVNLGGCHKRGQQSNRETRQKTVLRICECAWQISARGFIIAS